MHDDEGKPYTFGNANTDQLVDKWQAHLDPDTIKTWREWYPDIGKQFEQAIQEAFRKHAPEQARGGGAPASTQAGKRLAAK